MLRGRALRIVLVVVLLVGLAAYAFTAGGFLPWFLLYVYLVLLLNGLFVVLFGLRNIRTTRSVSAQWLSAGESLSIRVGLHKTGIWPLPWIRVQLDLPSAWYFLAKGNDCITQMISSRNEEMEFEIHGVERGVYSIGSTQLETGDLLGLVSVRRRTDERSQVTVFPQAVSVAGWLDSAESAGMRQPTGRIANDSVSSYGIRAYVPGDRLSRIHWGATARTGRLQSKAFEQYVSSEMMFVPDVSRTSFQGTDGAVVFELEMAIMASLVKHAFHLKKAFSSTFHADTVTQISKGCSDALVLRTFEALAGTKPTGPVDFSSTLGRLSGEAAMGTTLVVISPSLTRNMAVIAAMVQRKTPIEWFIPAPNRGLTDEDQAVVGLLMQAGVSVYIVHSTSDLASLRRGGMNRGANQ